MPQTQAVPPVDRVDPGRIETPRLLLRPPVYSDGPGLHALLSDPVACRFSPHMPVADLVITRFMIVEWRERRAQGLRTFVGISAGRPHEPIGFVSVGPDEELGGLLSPREGGRGLASEALRAVIEALRLRRAWAIIDAEHHALIHTLETVGIRPERLLPAHREHPQISADKRDCLLLRQQQG